MKTTRQIVAEALLKIENQKSWSNLTFDHQLRKYGLDARDAAFAGALFYGVLERLVTLDACIAKHSKTPLEKLSPAVLTALRMAVYQLLYLDGVPDHAAVSEGVGLVKKLRKGQAAGFVNGVLRSFLRDGKAIPAPDGSSPEALSIRYSCPLPLVELWLEHYGPETTETILENSLGRPPVYIRVNTLKTTPEKLLALLEARNIHGERDSILPDCLILSGQGAVQDIPEYKMGFFHVQDHSSQLCVSSLDVGPGMRVLDACAAPGGKSFTLAQLMAGEGELWAADLYPQRAELVAKQAKKMNLSNIKILAADMTLPQPNLGQFDRVLCDVPCSGLGVIRRKPEIKYKPLEEFSALPEIQYKILSNASQYCKEGGRLLYSTCTLHPVENSAVAERFLREHPDFAPSPLPEPLGPGHEQTLLFQWGGDGFYLALFEKR